MKSIIEEASSIAKAIDQAWNRAEKPQEFSVKIFEEPQRNMFGLTVKSAKIALFFDEKIAAHHNSNARQKSSDAQPRPAARERYDANRKSTPAPPISPRKEKKPLVQRPLATQQESAPQAKSPSRKQRPIWSDELIDATKKWINQSLSIIGLSNVSYETSVIGNNLNIQFKEKLLATDQDERWLFSSFAHLIMLGLGQSFKKRFPNLKIILKSSN